jgi:hypothetical protein
VNPPQSMNLAALLFDYCEQNGLTLLPLTLEEMMEEAVWDEADCGADVAHVVYLD